MLNLQQRDFLELFAEHRNAAIAAKNANTSLAEVDDWSSRSSEHFSLEFTRAYRVAQRAVQCKMLEEAAHILADPKSRQKMNAAKFVYQDAKTEIDRLSREIEAEWKSEKPEDDNLLDFSRVGSAAG